jgi:agmatine deiminase
MPAEWSPHSGCYISWPCREKTWQGHYSEAKRAYKAVIEAVSQFEPVTTLSDPSTLAEARRELNPHIKILELDLDDSWVRDNGPTFVTSADSKVAMVNFHFNGWGKKASYGKDDLVPQFLSHHLNVKRYDAPIVLEGGAITVDGQGTLLTTAQCLLNSNRNPCLRQAQIERTLKEYLGVKKVIWLAKGLAGDFTDGHVDGVACFARKGVVITAHTRDTSDPNYRALEDNAVLLDKATNAKGRPMEIIRIVQPRPKLVDGITITPSYINHYIANDAVVAPVYGIPEDKLAMETLRSVYPDREVVEVDARYIEIGGGAVHCITQQHPVGAYLPP